MCPLEQDNGESSLPEPRIYRRSEHSLPHRLIDRDALKIIHRLKRSGYQAYIVGGGVRDLLLGLQPKDFDISTSARPNEVKALFRNCRIIGRRFRLAHIYFRGSKIIEVSTFRALGEPVEETTPEGRVVLNENVYGDEASDAFRRDLTINALFYDPEDFAIIDYVGGVADIKARLARVIGDPNVRFAEDPVRLMRTVRHAARIDGSIEPHTLHCLQQLLPLLRQSSAVRIYEELRKDFHSGRALKVMRAFAEHGILKMLLPDVITENGINHLAPDTDLSRCLERVDQATKQGDEPSTTVVLAVIALFSGPEVLSRFDLSTRFGSEGALKDHLDDAFPDLAVPRKERERIEDLLLDWYSIAHDGHKNIKLGRLQNRPHYEDLRMLFSLLRTSDQEEDVLTLLENDPGGRAERRERGNRPQHGHRRSSQRRSGGRGHFPRFR